MLQSGFFAVAKKVISISKFKMTDVAQAVDVAQFSSHFWLISWGSQTFACGTETTLETLHWAVMQKPHQQKKNGLKKEACWPSSPTLRPHAPFFANKAVFFDSATLDAKSVTIFFHDHDYDSSSSARTVSTLGKDCSATRILGVHSMRFCSIAQH